MEPRRLILFRFDREPLVCRSRVVGLRTFNPGTEIHGLYGGEGHRKTMTRAAGRQLLGLDDLYVSRHRGMWNWRNPDLLIREWFRERGHLVDFDVLHVVEWDLLLMAPLADLYGHVPQDAVALTCLTPTSSLEGRWEWLTGKENLLEWASLRSHAEAAWGPGGPSMACLGAGPALPRRFVEAYAAAKVPELCHDELRLPLAASALGFERVDTGFRPHWFADRNEDPFFHVEAHPLSPQVLEGEWRRPDGRRAFHPVRHRVVLSSWSS